MTRKHITLFFVTVFVLSTLTVASASPSLDWEGQAERLWSSGTGIYNYTPSVIVDDEDVYHFWWCQNETEYEIIDFIHYRTGTIVHDEWEFSEPSRALSPGDEGSWESVHVCDPAVVKGKFAYDGEDYSWAMFYLGTDQLDNNHNQLGLALANYPEGPWVKIDANPLITSTSTLAWGVGQPSVTSIDGEGKVLLFYTKGNANGTHVFRRELNLRDLDDPVVGMPVQITELGLQSRDGVAPNIFHNADFAYDPNGDQFLVVAPQHPFDKEEPSWVSSSVQIARISGGDIWGGGGRWSVLGTIDQGETNKPRNHNAAIVRTVFGTLPEDSKVRLVVSTGDLGENWLWSYTLYEISGSLK